MAVVGVSGSGKSSLVKAGVLPELHGGTMAAAGSSWEVAVMRPGGDPLGNLASCLINADLHDPEEEDIHSHVRATLSRSGMGLLDTIEQSDLEEDSNLLLVVDQFEEIFRFRQQSRVSNEEAGHFITLLLEASQQMRRRIYVVLTMRSDFLGDCAQFRDLAEAVNEGEYLIPRLNRTQRKEAIVGPVKVGGSDISNRLLQRLLNDIGDDPDQLPILQHALMRTWEQWEAYGAEGPLDLEHYRATGGMSEALSRHADEVYAELQTDSAKWTASKIFKALTERADQDRGIRRPMRFGELCEITEKNSEEVASAIDPFRMAGRTFLMPGSETDLRADTIIDISHESLMRVWTRLKSWVDDEAQSAKIYRRLADTASLRKDGRAGLYRDPDLQIALSWRSESKPNKAWADHYFPGFEEAMGFLDESHSEAEKEAKEKEDARKRELEQAQALALAEQEKAEAERKRAEEKEKSANRMKLLSLALAFAGVLAICFLIFALIAKDEVETKVLELADRSAATAHDLSLQGKNLEALAWLNDAWSLAEKSEEKQDHYKSSMSELLQEIPMVTDVSILNKRIIKAGFDKDRSEFFTIYRENNSLHINNYNSSNRLLLNTFELPFPIESIRGIVQVDNLLLFRIGERTLNLYSLAKNELIQNRVVLGGWILTDQVRLLEKSNLLVLPFINTQARPMLHGQIAFVDINSAETVSYSDTFNETFAPADEFIGSIAVDQEKEIIYIGTSHPQGKAGSQYRKGNVYEYDHDKRAIKKIVHIKTQHLVNHLQYEPEDKLLVLTDGTGAIFPGFNTEDNPASIIVASLDGSIHRSFDLESAPLQIELIQDGNRLLSRSKDNSANLWDISTSSLMWKDKLQSTINSMKISPDECIALFATDSGQILGKSILGGLKQFSAILPNKVSFADFEKNSRSFIGIGAGGLTKLFGIRETVLNRIYPDNISSSTTAFGTDADSLGNYVLAENTAIDYPVDGLAIDYQTEAEDEFVEFSFENDNAPSHFRIWRWSSDMSSSPSLDTFSEKALLEVFNEEEELVHSTVVNFADSELSHMGCDPEEASKVRISNLTENFARLGFSEVAFFKEDRLNEHKSPEEGIASFLKVNSGYVVNTEGRLAVVGGSEAIHLWKEADFKTVNDIYRDDKNNISNSAKAAFYQQDLTAFLASIKHLQQDYNDAEINQMLKVASLSKGNQIPLTEKIDSKLFEYLVNEDKPDISQELLAKLSNEVTESGGALDLLYRYACVPDFFGDGFVDVLSNVNSPKSKYASLNFPEDISFSDGFTLECWIRHGNRGPLINKGGSFENDGFCLTLINGNYRFELQNTETKEKALLDMPSSNGRDWNHVALTWDASTKEMAIFSNGEKSSQTLLFEGPIGVNNGIPLILGRAPTRPHIRSLNSAFSELRIWSVCRNEKDIKENYKRRIEEQQSGLVFRRSFSQENIDPETKQKLDYYENVDWLSSNNLPFSPTKYIALGNSKVTDRQLRYSLVAIGGLALRKGDFEEAIDLLERAKYSGMNRSASRISPSLNLLDRMSYINRFLLGIAYLKADRLNEADEIVSDDMRVQGDWENRNLRNNGDLRRSLNLQIIGALREEYARERSRMQL